MRTFSHALVAAATGRRARADRAETVTAVLGGLLPDVPLLLLAALSMLRAPSWDAGMEVMHHTYETNPFWIAAHNTPHSLIVLGGAALLAWPLRHRRWARLALWGLAGAALHTAVDIFTHAGDGPRFLFPLNQYVFDSPVSYWDPEHFGRVFTVFEVFFDMALTGYLVWDWRPFNRNKSPKRT